jgi:hypothetical protein
MNENRSREIIKRLKGLEEAVFGKKGRQTRISQSEGFTGLKGGLRLLIERGFFKAKKALSATKQELEKQGYHYSAAAIQTTLNRLSTRAGPLAAFREGGKKVYVRRK